MNDITTDGRRIVIGENQIPLPAEITSVVQIQDTVVVLLDPDDEVQSDQNVWAFDTDGTLLWKAEKTRSPSNDINCYVKISEDDGNLWAADWKGMEYEIDPSTGKHVSKNFRK